MVAQPLLKEHKFLSLRERFQDEASLAPGTNPLIRLGALYRLSNHPDHDKVKQKLFELLAQEPKQRPVESSDASIFALHTAMLLAQQGAFEGIQWILDQMVSAPTRELRGLAEIALRNCSEFPFAALVSQLFDVSAAGVQRGALDPLLRYSEEELFALAERDRATQQAALSLLHTQLDSCQQFACRAGRHLGLGVILSRPAQKDYGYRYSGFIGVDDAQGVPRVVPYDISDVVNRDDQRARQSPWQLLGLPGRRVVLVYNTDDTPEALVAYVLPFAPLSREEVDGFISKAAVECDGLDIGVVIAKWTHKERGSYRLITSKGGTFVQSYRAEQQKIGSCFFSHSRNAKLLATRYHLLEPSVAEVVQRFVRNTTLERAVYLDSGRTNRCRLATQKGRILTKTGGLSADPIWVIESTKHGDFFFQLPGQPWPPDEGSRIWQMFFQERPEAFGVVLDCVPLKDGGLRARAVRALDGFVRLRPVEQPVAPGTLVYWDTNEKGELFATLLPGQCVIQGCPSCFGARYRVCATCGGRSKVTCPTCAGSHRQTCSGCYGSGQQTCGRCSGQGQLVTTCHGCQGGGVWVGECRNCNGSGTFGGSCRVCNGTGRYADTGRTCKKCSGYGTFTAPCLKCQGTGRVSGSCKRCEGRGHSTDECRSCHGTGRWECGTCHGKRTISCTCERGTVTCFTCQGNRISLCDCGGRWQGIISPV